MNKKILTILLVLTIALSFVSCGGTNVTTDSVTQTEAPVTTDESIQNDAADSEKIAAEGLWADAVYRSDKRFGEGSKTIEVEVKVDDKSVTFAIKTDKENLGDALIEHNLVEGEQGAYGLYIKKVNGITADYDVDKHYWSISKDGTALMTGADGETIVGGEHYEITRAK